MRTLKKGCRGADVQNFQQFLRGFQCDEMGECTVAAASDAVVADGIFGPATEKAVKAWQTARQLTADGVIGPNTWKAAVKDGFPTEAVPVVDNGDQNVPPDPTDVTADIPTLDKVSPGWPARPAGASPLVSNESRCAVFGKFAYKDDPTPKNPEHIQITDNWAATNIATFLIPQLAGLPGAPMGGKVSMHRLAGPQFVAWFRAIEAKGLANRLISFGGCWVPRYVRGSKTRLSNHAWGTAIDINVPWNARGHQSALFGMKGCVRELAEICYDFGIFWGGWYLNAPCDGMHFEQFRVLTQDELKAAKVKHGIV